MALVLLVVVTLLSLSLSRLPRSRSRSRRSRSSLKPYRPTAACSGREPELALRWRCSTWRRSGRRARTSPTGTPPSPTSTSGSYGTSSPSSSTNSYSSRPHRFASFPSFSLCPAAFLILGLVKALQMELQMPSFIRRISAQTHPAS